MARRPILVTGGEILKKHDYNPLMNYTTLSGSEPNYQNRLPRTWQELTCQGSTESATKQLFALRGNSGFRGDYTAAKRVVEQFLAAHQSREVLDVVFPEDALQALDGSLESELSVAEHFVAEARVNLGEAFYFIWLFKQTQPSTDK